MAGKGPNPQPLARRPRGTRLWDAAQATEENQEPEAPRAAALKMANVAPWGSAITEMRPTFSKSVAGI